MSNQFSLPAPEVQDTSGNPGSGWKLEFFESGTSTNLDTYTDDALGTAHANPVVADSRGQFAAIYLQARDYKVTLSDADDTLIWTIDPVRGGQFLGADDLVFDSDRDTFIRSSTDDQLEIHIANAKDFQFTANLFDVLAGSVIKVTGQLELAKGADIASAAALAADIDGNIFDVTGTTAITSIASRGVGSVIVLQFDGALTLTHDATDLILPGAANITTAAGDQAIFYEYASGDWRCLAFLRAAGAHLTIITTGTGSVTVAAGSTVFLGSTGTSATEALVDFRVPRAGTIRNFYVEAGGVPGAGETFTYTLRKNAADTAVTTSFTGASGPADAQDTTNTVAVAAGDTISVKLVTTGGAAATAHSATFELWTA